MTLPLILLVACSGQRAIAQSDFHKLTIVYSAVAAASIITWGPKEAGIFKKYRLDIDSVYVAGSTAATTLISGDADVVQGSGGAAILSRLAGSDVSIIATTTNVIPMRLVTTSDIASPKDIKGKSFGVTRFGSLTDLGLRKAISQLGMDPERDITVIQTGGEPENLLFMRQGRIKGALLSSLNLQLAREMGFRELVNLADTNFRYPATVLTTTSNMIGSRSDVLNRFLKAILEGIRYSKDNPNFTMKVLSKYTRITDTKALMSSYNDYVLGYIRDFPDTSAAEIESALLDLGRTHPKARTADAKHFFDSGPLQRLVREGFVKSRSTPYAR
jgi:NitT/TauT family transport system substrate-binding protein